LIDTFQRYAASAAAAFLHSVLAGAFPLPKKLRMQWGISILAFVAAVLILFLFFA